MPSRLLGGNALDLFRTAICAQQHSCALCALRNHSLKGRANPAGEKDNARRDNPACKAWKPEPCTEKDSASVAERSDPQQKRRRVTSKTNPDKLTYPRKKSKPDPRHNPGRKLAHLGAGKGDVDASSSRRLCGNCGVRGDQAGTGRPSSLFRGPAPVFLLRRRGDVCHSEEESKPQQGDMAGVQCSLP